ncbi:PepSY domain-containing protein [Corallococcus sp. AB032C]|uniref:PepSY-associated TM helix domain-containing protein n=1 Tax=Corallococcus TaxID=83461 RepID=UPI000EC012A4|nr:MULTISPECIES: PepSY-associated TM helix domain-containing protein [Corallococcus]NPC47053.1 PepSY domain-containing protein [Corallococcus exiguus]RKH86075.1 PepSY domain-containing protein [Corallococcus sp. AB032C]
MKLSPRTFRIQFDLHAWAGVVASLFLFVIFFCGVFAMFREELEVWQEPALHVAPPSESPPSFDLMLDRVREQGPLPRGAHVGMLTHEETRFITAYLFEPTGMRVLWLDPVTGTSLPERSRLASELYWMHFFYRVPWGMEFTGLVSVALLVALVSGLWIHLKDLRAQWWRFRPTAKPRFSASDAHKVLGIFGLPFTAMLAWTGAVLCMAGLAAQGFGSVVYRGQADRVTKLRGYSVPVREAAGKDAPMLSLDTVVDRARASVPGAEGTPRYVELHDYGDARGWAGVYFQLSPLGPDHFAHVDSVSGETFGSSVESRTPNFSFERLLFDLHAGRFAEALMKPLYALLALAMCAVLVTGNLIWLERRDPLRTHRGNRVLERLTVGVSAGLAFGTAVYCAANRVLPWALVRRGDWEFGLFLGAWALAVVIALVPRGSSRRVGSVLSAAAAVLFGAVVVGDVVTQDANLFTALSRGLPPVFIAEAFLAAMALGCGGLAWGVRRRKTAEPVSGGAAPEGPLVKA